MAGLAETCLHVAGILYWLETAVCLHEETTHIPQNLTHVYLYKCHLLALMKKVKIGKHYKFGPQKYLRLQLLVKFLRGT